MLNFKVPVENLGWWKVRCGVLPRIYNVEFCFSRIKMLVQDLNVPIVDADQKEDRKKVLVDYFIEDRHGHDWYAFRFFFCEFLNLFNVVGQLFFMNFFLGGEFTTYGSDVIAMTEMEQEERTDPMSKVFPKVCCVGFCQGFINNERTYWYWEIFNKFMF